MEPSVLPLRSRPFRTLLLGLCFFRSLLQVSASQWLPLCRFRSPLPFVSSSSLPSQPSPHFFSPLGSLPRFVFLLLSVHRRPLSVPLVPFLPDLVLGSAALPFTAPQLASQRLICFAFPPSQVWAFPLASFFHDLRFVSSASFASAFPPFASRSFPSFPLPSSALGSGYWAHRYTLKTEHCSFILHFT